MIKNTTRLFRRSALAAATATMLIAPIIALADADNPNILVIFQAEEGFPFFNPVKAGAEAETLSGNVNFPYGNGNSERLKSLFQSELAIQPDGVALTIIVSDAFDDEICALREAGIPVIVDNGGADYRPS